MNNNLEARLNAHYNWKTQDLLTTMKELINEPEAHKELVTYLKFKIMLVLAQD